MAKAKNQNTVGSYYQTVVDSFWKLTQGQDGQKVDSMEALIVKLETLTHLRRDQLAQVAILFFGLYFVLSALDGVLYAAFGVCYPLYLTVNAWRAQPEPVVDGEYENVTNGFDNMDQMRHWVAYWATYAVISQIDWIGTALTGHVYLFVKTAFLVYLYLPQTSGALTVFEAFIKPSTIAVGQTIASSVSKYRTVPE
uniref:Receptor expression-enhancing protein n=1 Tax=Panagrellus redivivus TaxID=6233 RepID=A0A7E4W2R5_PANRE